MANILNHAAIMRNVRAPLAEIRNLISTYRTPAGMAYIPKHERITLQAYHECAFALDGTDYRIELTVTAGHDWVTYTAFSVISTVIQGVTFEVSRNQADVNSIAEILEFAEGRAASASSDLADVLQSRVDDMAANMGFAVVSQAVTDIVAAGYEFTISDDFGENEDMVYSGQRDALDDLFQSDKETLNVMRDGVTVGTVQLVHGNDGYDVIADNSASLARVLAKADALAVKLETAYHTLTDVYYQRTRITATSNPLNFSVWVAHGAPGARIGADTLQYLLGEVRAIPGVSHA